MHQRERGRGWQRNFFSFLFQLSSHPCHCGCQAFPGFDMKQHKAISPRTAPRGEHHAPQGLSHGCPLATDTVPSPSHGRGCSRAPSASSHSSGSQWGCAEAPRQELLPVPPAPRSARHRTAWTRCPGRPGSRPTSQKSTAWLFASSHLPKFIFLVFCL